MATLAELKSCFRADYDSGDPWGSVMAWLFPIAEESFFNRDGAVADFLEFSPGAATEPEPGFMFADELRNASDSDLESFAELLHRFEQFCRAQNLDY